LFHVLASAARDRYAENGYCSNYEEGEERTLEPNDVDSAIITEESLKHLPPLTAIEPRRFHRIALLL
jgi:hypothetical protein